MIIKDKKLAPYQIHHDGSNYTVVKKTESKDSKGNRIFKSIAYCSSVESAITKITRLKVEQPEAVFTVKEYLKAVKKEFNKIADFVYGRDKKDKS